MCVCACARGLVRGLVRAVPSAGSYFELHARSFSLRSKSALRLEMCSARARARREHLICTLSHSAPGALRLPHENKNQKKKKQLYSCIPPLQTVEILLLPSVANETRDPFEVRPAKTKKENRAHHCKL